MAAYLFPIAVRCLVTLVPFRYVPALRITCCQVVSKTIQGYTSSRKCCSSTSISSESPTIDSGDTVTEYDRLVQCGSLREDALQRSVLQRLASLQHTLQNYSNTSYLNPPPLTINSNCNRLPKRTEPCIITSGASAGKKEDAPPPPPKGFYIYGDVGTGKTMLMDLFFCGAKNSRKRRVHFNGFMLEIHQRIHRQKQSLPSRTLGNMFTYDPISPVATEIAHETCLLCFDEFQEHCHTICLDSGLDYRRLRRTGTGKLYFLTREPGADATLNAMFDELALTQTSFTGPKVLTVLGREVTLEKTCGSVADCTFYELCGRSLGASDYLEMARLFDTVFIRRIPVLTLRIKDQVRRFTTLVDNFYDHKVRVVIQAAAPLDELFVQTGGDDERDQELLDDLGLKELRRKRLPFKELFPGSRRCRPTRTGWREIADKRRNTSTHNFHSWLPDVYISYGKSRIQNRDYGIEMMHCC
ncbi:lactation elevated protein 1 homolog B isoform X6 [Syngnathus scovelli]|uniref:lactation elevated protein 1 homolog B isoform X6 n=1 Tax=Syngnathus scovelli TaxID=161590 RepID=UPI0035CC30D3